MHFEQEKWINLKNDFVQNFMSIKTLAIEKK